MAWKNPTFYYVHEIRDVVEADGIASLTTVGTEAADFPKENLFDDRVGTLFKWTDSTALHEIILDRGSGTLSALDFFYLSIGAVSMVGAGFAVESDTDISFPSPTSLASGTFQFAAGGTHGQLMVSSTERYIRLRITATGAWEISELRFSKKFEPLRGLGVGHGPDADWSIDRLISGQEFAKASGATGFISTGPNRNLWTLTYRGVGFEDASDIGKFDAFVDSAGLGKPFVWLPPFLSQTSQYEIMRMTAPTRKRFDWPTPNVTGGVETYSFAIQFADHIA